MDVRCTSCNTGMEIDLESLPTDTVKIKCSSCGMLFSVTSDRQALALDQDLSSAPPQAHVEYDELEGQKPPVSITLELNAEDERTEAVAKPKRRLGDTIAVACMALLIAIGAYAYWSGRGVEAILSQTVEPASTENFEIEEAKIEEPQPLESNLPE